jgi:hypothetical protein
MINTKSHTKVSKQRRGETNSYIKVPEWRREEVRQNGEGGRERNSPNYPKDFPNIFKRSNDIA